MSKIHYIEQKLASNQHKTTVIVIGVGGTGSHVLINLAMMSEGLEALGIAPLHVTAFDDDIVELHNVGRQSFSIADLGMNKAEIMITRINRFYGTSWNAVPRRFREKTKSGVPKAESSNFIISCVDSLASRRLIDERFPEKKTIFNRKYNIPNESIYWMDLGNSKSSGQVILGTLFDIQQPKDAKDAAYRLPSFFDEFPNPVEDLAAPSCSAAASLSQQDMFINKILATFAVQLLWDLLKNFRIDCRGVYVNLEDYRVSKIPID